MSEILSGWARVGATRAIILEVIRAVVVGIVVDVALGGEALGAVAVVVVVEVAVEVVAEVAVVVIVEFDRSECEFLFSINTRSTSITVTWVELSGIGVFDRKIEASDIFPSFSSPNCQ